MPVVNGGGGGGAGGAAYWTEVVKSADQSIANSSTLTNDTELFFTAVAGAIYQVEASLVYGSPAGVGTPDMIAAFGEDTNTLRGMLTSMVMLGATDAIATQSTKATDQTTTFTLGTAATDRLGWVIGGHIGNGGVFRVKWAQGTSGANATIMRAGATLRYHRVV